MQTSCPSHVIGRIRQIYEKCEGVILPVPWDEDFSFEVEKIFTSPRIVEKEKARRREAKAVTSLTGIFKPHKDCQQPQIVLIEGVSGMGKTTFCQKLAYDWATREGYVRDESFPIIEVLLLLRCGEMKSSIWEAIDDQILPEEIGPELKEMFFKFLRENPSKVLLLLDGLDEANPQNLELCVKILQRKELPPWHIVVTSRHEVGSKVRRYSNTLLEIVGFEETDVECFIRRYFQCQHTEDLGEELISKLRSHPRLLAEDLKELTRNPLNTLFLCVIFEDLKGDLPNHRTELFIEIVYFVLRRYEKKNGLSTGGQDLLSVYKKELVILGRKALDSLHKGELHFENNNEDFKKSAIIKFGFLSIQVGSNRRAPCHRYQFLHKSFQEFFAGLFLAFSFVDGEMKDNTEFLDPKYLDQWFQVFVFMSGIVVLQYKETALSVVHHIALIVNKAGHSFSKYDSYLRLALHFMDECRSCSESLHKESACKFGKILDLLDLDLSNFVVFYNYFATTLSLALTVNTTVTTLNMRKTCLNSDGVDSISEALRKNNSLTTLDLSANSISDRGTNSLSEALAVNNSLSSLHLSSNSISNEGATFLSKALKYNTSLTTLVLHDNVIEDDGASSLSEALRVNTSLATLDLSNNSIECDGANSLSEALNVNSSLTTLNLSGNPIGREGATVLSTTLRRNTCLSTLDLSGSSIDDEGTNFLFQAMRGNTSLTSLHLAFNSISNKGAKCISQALLYNSSLSSLYLDNNSIGDEGATSLSELLRRNTSLATLDLAGNFIGDKGTNFLSETLAVNNSLNSLHLSSNAISNEGATFLSMALKNNTSLTTLILRDNVIKGDGASSLSEALRVNTSLATLDLSNNSIECDGANSLSEALNVNSSLTTLNLSGNPIGREGATVLSTTLRRNTCLSTLDLSGSSIDDEGTNVLFQAMRVNTSLTSLHLAFNSISNKGAKCISQALLYNSSLSSLYLDNNSIGDEGATSLSELLRRNTSLAILDLSGNLIGDEGASSLYRALAVNTSLKLRL